MFSENFLDKRKINAKICGMENDHTSKKKKTTTIKSEKRVKSRRTAHLSEKQPPKLHQKATKAVEAVPSILPKPKQKQLGKSKAQVKLRAKKIAEGIIGGMTRGDALRSAGYSETVAQNPSGVLLNPLIKKTYCEILDAAGATDEACAKVISDAIQAVRTVSCISGKDADAKTVDFIDVDDHPTRLKAVDMVHKVRGRYIEKKVITGPDGGPVMVKTTELTDEELLRIARRGRAGASKKAQSSRKPT